MRVVVSVEKADDGVNNKPSTPILTFPRQRGKERFLQRLHLACLHDVHCRQKALCHPGHALTMHNLPKSTH